MGKIIIGDCREVLKTLAENSVDAVVTDPPYGLEFMGKDWDAPWKTDRRQTFDGTLIDERKNPYGRSKVRYGNGASYGADVEPMRAFQAWATDIFAECLRVLKPGGHLLSFGGSRTYHRMACAVEDAGFEIRDQIMWIYGQGFPKSKNLDGDWEGWGTALKPAHEPIVLARKPLSGTVEKNVLAHRTGALNIDGCRVEHVTVEGGSLALNPHLRETINGGNGGCIFPTEKARRVVTPHQDGRWPANIIHDGSDEVVNAFPDAPGQLAMSVEDGKPQHNKIYSAMKRGGPTHIPRKDSGSAARFFYCAKASKKDRGEGNNHPTVKPTELMRYLCKLVTPPGGLILDPFLGSGSTGKAAAMEGFDFIGIELSEDYAAISERRMGLDLV